MSKNYRLIEYFVSEFYWERLDELAHIVSPDFVYISPINGKMNFAQYTAHMKRYSVTATTKIDKITSDNDVDFVVYFTLTLINSTAKYGDKISDKMRFQVKDGLVVSAEVGYDQDQNKSDEFVNIF